MHLLKIHVVSTFYDDHFDCKELFLDGSRLLLAPLNVAVNLNDDTRSIINIEKGSVKSQ